MKEQWLLEELRKAERKLEEKELEVRILRKYLNDDERRNADAEIKIAKRFG